MSFVINFFSLLLVFLVVQQIEEKSKFKHAVSEEEYEI